MATLEGKLVGSGWTEPPDRLESGPVCGRCSWNVATAAPRVTCSLCDGKRETRFCCARRTRQDDVLSCRQCSHDRCVQVGRETKTLCLSLFPYEIHTKWWC